MKASSASRQAKLKDYTPFETEANSMFYHRFAFTSRFGLD